NFVQRDADLLFVLSRLRLDRKSNRSFGILDRVVNDRCLLVAERVNGLCLFQFYTRDDIAGVRFADFVELFALHHVQRAETFHESTSRVERVRISREMTTDDLENVDAACEWIGNG